MKKNTMRNIFFILMLLWMAGCSNNNHGNYMKFVHHTPSLELKKGNALRLNINCNEINNEPYDYIDSIKLIKLQATEESIIGDISKAIITKNRIFIFDYFKSQAILVFNTEGDFLYKIHKTGDGPGEYKSLNMGCIDGNSIFINDPISWKFIEYDLDGNFLSEKILDPTPIGFIVNGNNLLLGYTQYTEKMPFSLVITNTSQPKMDRTALPFWNTRPRPSQPLSEFQKTEKGTVLYQTPPCDTIFEINNNNVVPRYILGLNSYSKTRSFYNKTKDANNKEFISEIVNSDISIYYSFVELEKNLFVNFRKNKTLYFSFLSRETGICKNFIAADIGNDKIYIPFLNVCGYYGNNLISSIDGQTINRLDRKEKEKFLKHLTPQSISDINSLSNDDNNPLLCIINLKGF